jgi:hypothetical protein
MQFLVFTKVPATKGLLGPIASKIVRTEIEADSLEAVKDQVEVKLGGECVIVPMEHAIVIKPRLVNEVVSNG